MASGTAQMMQVMEAGVTAPAGVFGMNAVMLPEHMRNAVLAEVCLFARVALLHSRPAARPRCQSLPAQSRKRW